MYVEQITIGSFQYKMLKKKKNVEQKGFQRQVKTQRRSSRAKMRCISLTFY